MADVEVDFVSCCPVFGCPNNVINKSINWVHSGCGGREKINGRGYLRCIRCNKSGPIIDWRFKCENHDYKEASKYGIANMLSILAQIETKNKGNVKFINSLTRSLLKMQLEIDEDDYC